MPQFFTAMIPYGVDNLPALKASYPKPLCLFIYANNIRENGENFCTHLSENHAILKPIAIIKNSF